MLGCLHPKVKECSEIPTVFAIYRALMCLKIKHEYDILPHLNYYFSLDSEHWKLLFIRSKYFSDIPQTLTKRFFLVYRGESQRIRTFESELLKIRTFEELANQNFRIRTFESELLNQNFWIRTFESELLMKFFLKPLN